MSMDVASGGGAMGGIAARKTHPIFSKAKTSDPSNVTQASAGSDFCDLFVCKDNLNNSDPRLRPPICCVIVGVVVIASGITVIILNTLPPVIQITGVVVTCVGAAILLFSFGWLFVTRQTILKNLKLKSLPLSRICPKHGIRDSCMDPILSADPIMTRGLVSIQYRSCEDTLPPGYRKGRPATKSVHVPQKDNFLSVESSCFQLIASPGDSKGRRNLPQVREKNNNNAAQNTNYSSNRRPFEDRYMADNDYLIASKKPPQRPLAGSEYIPKHTKTLPVQGKPLSGHVLNQNQCRHAQGSVQAYIPADKQLSLRRYSEFSQNDYIDSDSDHYGTHRYRSYGNDFHQHVNSRKFNPFTDPLDSGSETKQ